MDNSKILIRSYTPKDLETIAVIEEECFSSPWSKKALEDFTDSEYSNILIAEFDNEVAGYVTFTSIFDEIQIANVAVFLKFRRLHIGSMLIERLIEYGKDKSCSFVTLEVRESNNAAISLYTKMGFTVVGERKGYYTKPYENAILMNYFYSC